MLTKLFEVFLVGSCTLCMYTLCTLDENSNIDTGTRQVLLLLLLFLLLLLKITVRDMSKVKLIPSSISSISVVFQL